jgi:oxygen-independent coproporphyrinogen-3 oxidase
MVRTRSGGALRFCTTALLAEYLRGDEVAGPLQDVHELRPSEEMEEAWFLGLRLRAGVAWQDLTAAFGSDQVQTFRPVVHELCRLELLTEEQGVVRLTRRGLLFSNEVFARFLEVEEQELQLQ